MFSVAGMERARMSGSYGRTLRCGLFLLPGVATIALTSGCDKTVKAFDARPVLTFADLETALEDESENTFVLSEAAFPAGRFPMRIAVVRVTVGDTPCLPDTPRLVFVPIEGIDCPPWDDLISNLPAVTEMFFLQAAAFPRKEISIAEITEAAARLGAGLCLIYAESDLQGGAAQVIGVIADAPSNAVVSTLTAKYEPRLYGYELDRPLDRPEGDDRHKDSRYLAGAKFRELVHDCLLALIDGTDDRVSARIIDTIGR